MVKEYAVYFKDDGNMIFLKWDRKNKGVKATQNINNATIFTTLENAQKFIEAVKKINSSKQLHIFEANSL